MKIRLSIIVPVRNEGNYINELINSIFSQDYGEEFFEILIIDGQSTDDTVSKIETIRKNRHNIFIFNNLNRTVPYALNIGIQNAKGEVIIRLDAHSTYPPNYFSELVRYLYDLDADNVGGVFDTVPANDSIVALAISESVKHPFSVGNSYHRIGKSSISQVDTVPYGCFKKTLFDKIGLFDTDLVRNQDDEFNSRIIKNGGKIFLLPFLKIRYHARNSIKKTSVMFFQYGMFKPLVNRKIGSLTSTRQLVPALFLLGLFIGLGLSFVHPYFAYSYILFLIIYIITLLITSINVQYKTKKNNIKLIYLIPYIIFLIHVSYGFGYLYGLINLNRKTFWIKRSSINTNR